jgi:fructose-1,6-bisphosphatase/inositol monophosphatase family enzyme
MIVCLVDDRQTVGGWILDVPNDRMAAAIKGQGVAIDGKAIVGRPLTRPPNGLMGWGVRKVFDKQLSADQRRLLGPLTTLNCAGREYIELLSGTYDFNLYRRTKPWDHAAGALMMVEAGGRAVRFNRGPFQPEGPLDGGIISGLTAEAVSAASDVLEMVELPLLRR